MWVTLTFKKKRKTKSWNVSCFSLPAGFQIFFWVELLNTGFGSLCIGEENKQVWIPSQNLLAFLSQRFDWNFEKRSMEWIPVENFQFFLTKIWKTNWKIHLSTETLHDYKTALTYGAARENNNNNKAVNNNNNKTAGWVNDNNNNNTGE